MAFKYQVLAQQVVQDIGSNRLAPGSALPALRKFAAMHSVSLTTATQAYSWLEQQGLIYSKAQSGFYVKGQAESRPLALPLLKPVSVDGSRTEYIYTVTQNALSNDLNGFSNGYLDANLRPAQQLQRALKRSTQSMNAAYNAYGEPAGITKLRAAISEQMQDRNVNISSDNVVVTNGCLEALNLLVMEYTKPGDTVALLTPCYSGSLNAVRNLDRAILEIPCSAEGPDIDLIEQLCKENAFKTLIFSCTAFNPLGFNLSVNTKKRIAYLAKTYKIFFIEDDTFGSLSFLEDQATPAFAYDHAGFILYCSSFSKDLAPNLRLGWVATQNNVDNIIRRKLSFNISSPTPNQHAMADYLFSVGYSSHIRQLRAILKSEVFRLQEYVLRLFPEGTQISEPAGGFFLWVALPAAVSRTLYTESVAQGIGFVPGDAFTLTENYQNCIRLSANTLWSHERETNLCVIGKLANQLCN